VVGSIPARLHLQIQEIIIWESIGQLILELELSLGIHIQLAIQITA